MVWLLPAVVVLGAGTAAQAPAPDDAAVEALALGLAAAEPAARLASARAIAALPPSGAVRWAKRLTALGADPSRVQRVPAYRAVLLAIWAQVPNTTPGGDLWMRKPEPAWRPPPPSRGQPRARRPPPHDPEKVDWLAALAALDTEADPDLAPFLDRASGRAEALEIVALLRALGASGRTEAVDPLFDFAFALEGVFRDECGRMVRAVGPPAVPALIRRQHRAGRGLARQHRYAAYQLDRMDRARPTRAIASAPDDALRADTLRAYGEALALDAVEAVLEQVDAPSRSVRREARWAWSRYVAGPAPPSAPKRRRKLPGGKLETEEKEDYLNYREMAELALAAKVAEVLKNDPAAASGSLAQAQAAHAPGAKVTEALYGYYDARRAAEWDAAFLAARTKEQAGDLPGAAAGYSWVLAHDPFYERRPAMAGALHRLGESLSGSDPGEAARWLREAVALEPDAEWARGAAARAELLAGAGGVAAAERALAIDPSLAEARERLASRDAARARKGRLELGLSGAAIVLAALGAAGGGAVARRIRRRLRRTSSDTSGNIN